MTITKINLNEDNNLEFELSIQGADAGNSKPRFCIVLDENREYVFPGKYSAGKVDFNIPILESMIDAGIYECRLEVIVDNHYFAPINDAVEFVMPVAIKEAKVVNTVEEKAEPSVSINSLKVNANPIPAKEAVTVDKIANIITESNDDRVQVQFVDGKMSIDTSVAKAVLDIRSKLEEDQQSKFNDLILTKSGFIKLTKLLK